MITLSSSAAASKAQTTSLEFFIVSGVVVLVIVASYLMYDLTASRTTEAHNKIAMELIATDIMDTLVRSNGIPGGWEDFPPSTSTFGLASSPLVVDTRKVDAFTAFDYTASKNIMGISGFQYFFDVRTLNNTILKQSGLRPANPKIVVNPVMAAVMNGTVVYVDFMLWR